MVAGSVTKGTIPDYMHGCNGQKAFPHGQGEENTRGPRAWLLPGELSWKICSGKVLQCLTNKGKPALTPFKIPFLLPKVITTFLTIFFLLLFCFIASLGGKRQQMRIPFGVWQLLVPKINSLYPTGRMLSCL